MREGIQASERVREGKGECVLEGKRELGDTKQRERFYGYG